MPVGVAYTVDLRWRIVWLNVVHKFSAKFISDLLCVSERSTRRYIDMFELTGDIQPKCQCHGPQLLLGEYEQLTLLRIIAENTGIYLHEVQDKISEEFGVTVSVSTICRTLHIMGCCRRVIRHVALQRSDELCARFMAEISIFEADMIIWIDESSCDRRHAMRKFAYTLRGIPPVDHRLLVRGTRYSAITAMSARGIEDVNLVEGTVNGTTFAEFVRDSLLPILQPFNGHNCNSVVVMDNASIHHVDEVTELIMQSGALLRFLPPYCPDLNPCEQAFSKVKAIMKENDLLFQAFSEPRLLLTMAFIMITQNDCMEYIKCCGYC